MTDPMQAGPASAAGLRAARGATPEVVFYQLNAKVLERAEDIPEDAKQVVYYSLAIGHHIGVFDCFKPAFRCSTAVYDRVLEALSGSGEAHRKLSGLLRFGEITVDSSHVKPLIAAIEEALPAAAPDVAAWLDRLRSSLDAIRREPAIYLMGRRLS
ncbi:formate hydrogenlyase maturation HycH family protein [Azospirillum thermophilum]|uniref:Formate hydrogenlyase maturation protein HycH n=1 Tax=Azospirillum thermophilum TaxID=2202148 RepID=A0A2S2CMQ8_9PROT|nr:formate hydrogenlyase maturation HycH family protein [Azospirillum thermophilum]AWK85660.1 formate hydrogenlyase maturation protein HycH [Azospirillum thermophilum]